MLSTRFIFLLFGLALLVDAKSVSSLSSVEDDWDVDDVDDFFDKFDEQALRVRRDVDVEKETSDPESNSQSGESGGCTCSPPPPGHPHPHPHPCQGLSRNACREKMLPLPPPYNGPPCELRVLFRLPTGFNHTARKECFEKWEKPALEKKGVDFSKPFLKNIMRHHFLRTLMVVKGCDSQCMFSENKLVVEDDGAWTISKEAVTDSLKEEDDPQEMTDIFEETINKCVEEASELVHPKQSCKSGSDEFLSCVRLGIYNACPGARWKGNRSCIESGDANTKLRNCRREQRSISVDRFRKGAKGFQSF